MKQLGLRIHLAMMELALCKKVSRLKTAPDIDMFAGAVTDLSGCQQGLPQRTEPLWAFIQLIPFAAQKGLIVT